MDITLKSLVVDSFNKNYNSLTWELSEIPAGNFSIQIYRSEGPGENISEYDLITTVPISSFTYTDTGVGKLADFSRSWYYKLKILNMDDVLDFLVVPTIPITANDVMKDKVGNEILRLKELSLTRFTQRTLYLLKRRTWGTHCTVCWDETYQRSTDEQCPVCAGTGWVRGYFDPVRFKGVITPSPSHNQVLQFGLWKDGSIMMTCLNYPKLVAQDIIVDDIGNRWKVADIRKLEKLGRLIEQQAQLESLGYDDIAYKFAVVKNEFTGLKL